MSLGHRLRQYRKVKNMSQEDLADYLGYKSFTTIQKWEKDQAVPPIHILEKLSRLFEISIGDLLAEANNRRKVPIVGVVAGGSPITAIENWIGEYEVDLPDLHNDYFYLRVVGDSMINARIFPGDDLFVRKQSNVNNGDIGVVMIDQEATVKRILFKGNNIILKPENEKYEPMIFTPQDIESKRLQILGKVLHNRINF
jgi:repressor LexA